MKEEGGRRKEEGGRRKEEGGANHPGDPGEVRIIPATQSRGESSRRPKVGANHPGEFIRRDSPGGGANHPGDPVEVRGMPRTLMINFCGADRHAGREES